MFVVKNPEAMEPQIQKLSPVVSFLQRDEIRAGIRWLALLIAPIIVSAISALAISLYLPPVYAARTDLVLHLQQTGDAAVRYLANQAVIIKSPAVLGPVAEKTGITSERLDKQLSVEFPKGGSVMRIQYENQNPH
jgi:capsular polysaccharide biosynthesis protein